MVLPLYDGGRAVYAAFGCQIVTGLDSTDEAWPNIAVGTQYSIFNLVTVRDDIADRSRSYVENLQSRNRYSYREVCNNDVYLAIIITIIIN